MQQRESDVGVVLDGIAGMFGSGNEEEESAYIQSRKGIVAIALLDEGIYVTVNNLLFLLVSFWELHSLLLVYQNYVI